MNSAYAGKIYLSGGTLALNGGTSIGSGALVISNNATFALPGSGSSVFIGGAVSVPAGQTANITSGVLSSGFSGNFSSGNSNVVLNLSGGMSFSGTTSAQFDGFTGTINLQPGAELRYSANSSGNTFGSLNPTLVINGTLHPRNAGNTVVLGTISGSGIISGPQSTNGTGDTLYVIGGNNSSSTFTGTISSNSSAFSGEVALTKTGSGTLTLTGTSTYTGGTTVEDGTLRMNNITGSGTGSGDVEIFSGATLAGSGIIAGATTLDNGATLAPGNSAGTLTFSNSLTLNDGTVMQFELGTNSDHVVVSGAFALAGTINVTAIGGFGAGTYTLFNYTPASGYDIGNVTLGTLPAGSYNYALATNTPGQVNLVVSTTAPPILSAPVYSGGNLILSGTGGTPGTNYYVLTSTNVVLPMVNWTPLATNQFDGSGNFAFTNAVSIGTPQLFYRVQVP